MKGNLMEKLRTYIFDLDMTVIDSSHRKVSLPDGSIDLLHWKENCTPEKIFKDEVMPLATFMREAYRHHRVVICTARELSAFDIMYLRANNLPYDMILHRGKNDHRPDGKLKSDLISDFLFMYSVEPSDCVFFEDNLSVHEAMKPLGILTIHPEDAVHADIQY